MTYEATQRVPTPPSPQRPAIWVLSPLWLGYAIVLLIVAIVLLAATLS